jgi:butyryl-CoA dehydrogenase
MSGKLPLMQAIKRLMDEVLEPSMPEELDGILAAERQQLTNAKKAGLVAAGTAAERFMTELADQQEVLASIADIIIEIYAMESAVLRTQKIAEQKGEAAAQFAVACTQNYVSDAMAKIEVAARRVVTYCTEGDDTRMRVGILRRLLKHEPTDAIRVRQQIAQRVLEAGKYVTQ